MASNVLSFFAIRRRTAPFISVDEEPTPTSDKNKWSFRSLSPRRRAGIPTEEPRTSTEECDAIASTTDGEGSPLRDSTNNDHKSRGKRQHSTISGSTKSPSHSRRHSITNAFSSLRRRSHSRLRSTSPSRGALSEHSQALSQAMQSRIPSQTEERSSEDSTHGLLNLHTEKSLRFTGDSVECNDVKKSSPISIPKKSPPPNLPPLQMPEPDMMIVNQAVLTGRPPDTPILEAALLNNLWLSMDPASSGESAIAPVSPVKPDEAVKVIENPFDDRAQSPVFSRASSSAMPRDISASDDGTFTDACSAISGVEQIDPFQDVGEREDDVGYISDVESDTDVQAVSGNKAFVFSERVVNKQDRQLFHDASPSINHELSTAVNIEEPVAIVSFRPKAFENSSTGSSTHGQKVYLLRGDAGMNIRSDDLAFIEGNCRSSSFSFDTKSSVTDSVMSLPLEHSQPSEVLLYKQVYDQVEKLGQSQLQSSAPSSCMSQRAAETALDNELTPTKGTSTGLQRFPARARQLRFANKFTITANKYDNLHQQKEKCEDTTQDVQEISVDRITTSSATDMKAALPDPSDDSMYAASANRFEDQNGWSPVHDPEFFEAASIACRVSEETFIHGLCTRGGPASFWTKMGLSQSTAPNVDTQGLCIQDAKLLVKYLTIRPRIRLMRSHDIGPRDSKLREQVLTGHADIENNSNERHCGSSNEPDDKIEYSDESSNLTGWDAGLECPPVSLVSSDASKAESCGSGRQSSCHSFLFESDDAVHSSRTPVGCLQATIPPYSQGIDITQMTFGGRGRRNEKHKMTRIGSISGNSSDSSEYTLTEEPYQVRHYF